MMDAYSILWADLMALKRRGPRYLITTLVSPILYLVAFGWGLGRGINLNGTSYLEFVIPGIIALTAMTTSFNGAGTRLNVDRLYFKSFDECLMAPIGLTSLLMGKALIGVVRGVMSSVAFLIVATADCATYPYRAAISARPVPNLPDLRFSGSAGCTAGQVSRGHGHIRKPDTDAHDIPGRDLLLFEPGAGGTEVCALCSAAHSRQPVPEGGCTGSALALGLVLGTSGVLCGIPGGRDDDLEKDQHLTGPTSFFCSSMYI